MKKILIAILFAWISVATSADNINPEIIKRTKYGVVSVVNSPHKSAYSRLFSMAASGFVVDKMNGIVVTNAHVATYQLINNLRLTFFNGKELEAQFIYSDPTQDFAFLKVDPTKIPKDVAELKLSREEALTGQSVFIVGNNARKDFSIQVGVISNKYQIVGYFPGQTYSVSLNTRGGSSGSPVLNHRGEVIALNFAGGETAAEALNIRYVIDALEDIAKNLTPRRLGMGALVSYYFLDKAAKYSNFPEELVASYIKQYPDALNRALMVNEVFEDSPAAGVLMSGDIIWQVNGKDIGPNLYMLDSVINRSKTNISLTIYREGVKQNVQIKPYDMHKNTIKRMVAFGGAIFYESDEYIRVFTGAKLGSVCVTNIDSGSVFRNVSSIYGLARDYDYFHGKSMVNVLAFNDAKIHNLDDLIKAIPNLIKKKNFTIRYTNLFFSVGYNGFTYDTRTPEFAEASYKTYGEEPAELVFNDSSHVWDVKKIDLTQ